jgi:hypothetical protein
MQISETNVLGIDIGHPARQFDRNIQRISPLKGHAFLLISSCLYYE